MPKRISTIQYKNNFTFHILFEDDREGDVDFSSFIWGEAFDELKNKSFFKKATIDKTTGTITWPNGVDLAPEAIYKKTLTDSPKSSTSHLHR